MKPLVSILIPAYNAAQYLAETLDSALAQTWDNIEIIVVDDGSMDNTLSIAKQYESNIVKVISQSNQGQSASENRALQEAQGDFIQYLDADDLLAPDKIERQIQLLGDHTASYVAAGEWARFFQTPEDACFIPEPVWADLPPVDWLIRSWEGGGMMHGAAWLIPRKIADRAGSWNPELSLINDFDYFCRLLLASEGIRFCQGARSYYRSGNSSSLSASNSDQAWCSAFRAMNLGTDHLLAHENSDRTRHACTTVLQRLIYEVYPDAADLRHQAEAKVKQLGGSDLPFTGGPALQLISALLGWQRAKRLQRFAYRYGYHKAAFGWKIARFAQRWRSKPELSHGVGR